MLLLLWALRPELRKVGVPPPPAAAAAAILLLVISDMSYDHPVIVWNAMLFAGTSASATLYELLLA